MLAIRFTQPIYTSYVVKYIIELKSESHSKNSLLQ